jgi:hypothetical protein
MTNTVYTFGPQAHPSIAISLKDALQDMYPSFVFRVEMVDSLNGPREAVVLPFGPPAQTTWIGMQMFSRGFVAGFGGGITPPTRKEALRRTQTRADCPAAKRNSDPPPAMAPAIPITVDLKAADALPSIERTQMRGVYKRFNTLTGVAPQSNRPRA